MHGNPVTHEHSGNGLTSTRITIVLRVTEYHMAAAKPYLHDIALLSLISLNPGPPPTSVINAIHIKSLFRALDVHLKVLS